ncbi:hypothetical protein ACLB2K_016443 [Fragaria x ananassa]
MAPLRRDGCKASLASIQLNSTTSVIHAVATVGAAYRQVNGSSGLAAASNADVIKWIPLAPYWVKLNFYGSMMNSSAAAGFVIRNSSGDPLVAGPRGLHPSSVPVAECHVLRDGLLAAKRFNHKNLVVESNSLLVLKCVQGSSLVPWRIKSIVHGIATLAKWFDNISFSHIFREMNFLADALADLGHSLTNPKIWCNTIPTQVSITLHLDVIQVGCPWASCCNFLFSLKK